MAAVSGSFVHVTKHLNEINVTQKTARGDLMLPMWEIIKAFHTKLRFWEKNKNENIVPFKYINYFIGVNEVCRKVDTQKIMYCWETNLKMDFRTLSFVKLNISYSHI
jgi:hypothetical protein